MLLESWVLPVADFTSPEAAAYGATRAVCVGGHAVARPWAQSAHRGGFRGIAYWLSQDPEDRQVGLAVFGKAGENPPSGWDRVSTSPMPVGLGKEAAELFRSQRSAPK